MSPCVSIILIFPSSPAEDWGGSVGALFEHLAELFQRFLLTGIV